MNITKKLERISGATSRWFDDNSMDLLLAAIAGLVIASLLLALRSYGRRVVREGGDDRNWRRLAGRVLARTGLIFIILCAVELVAQIASLPRRPQHVIDILFTIATALQGAVWARELVLGFIQHRLGGADGASTFGSAVGLIRGLVSVALFAIALVLILDNLGVNVTGLVAGLGIGGVAIGLAAQGVFKDLFAALAIILDKPFHLGEAIKFDAFSGTVEQIGLKSTRIRSVDGEQIVISNAILLDKVVLNQSAIEQRRIVFRFGLIYQTEAGQLARLPELLRDAADVHEHLAFVRGGLVAIGPSSLDCEAEYRFSSADYDLFFRIRAQVGRELLHALSEAGLVLAYPSQTSFTAGPDGRHVLP